MWTQGEQALELVNPDQPDIRLQAPILWAQQLAQQTGCGWRGSS